MSGVFGAIGGIFGAFGGIALLGLDVLTAWSVQIFLIGFFGVLLTFLWFFFKYIDKKSLVLPAMFFTLCFLLFLGGNILLIAKDVRETSTSRSTETVKETEVSVEPQEEPVEELPEPAMNGSVNL